jgi:hypothetical protein
MTTLRVRQDVALIFIMTEGLKTQLTQEANDALEQIQAQIGQFDFRAQHALAELQRTDLSRAMAARQQIEAEKRKMEAVRNDLQQRKREIDVLEIGSEYPRGAIEGTVEVTVGDNLFEKLAGAQIVVKDGLIQEIRTVALAPDQILLPSLGGGGDELA